jgi:hypothetical protein
LSASETAVATATPLLLLLLMLLILLLSGRVVELYGFVSPSVGETSGEEEEEEEEEWQEVNALGTRLSRILSACSL